MARKPVAAVAAAAPKPAAFAVRAKAPGFYGAHRRQGESFSLAQAGDFARWMEPIGWDPSSGAATEQAADPEPATDTRVAELEAENADLRDIGSRAIGQAADLQGRVDELEGELAQAKAIGVADFLAANGFKPGDLLEIQEDGSVRVAGQSSGESTDGESTGGETAK